MLKILHLFYLSLLTNILIGACAYAQAPVPGLYTSLKKLVDTDRERIYRKIELLSKNSYSLSSLDGNQVSLEADYLNSLILNTPSQYVALSLKDKCSFYDLILSNLIKDAEGTVQNFIVTEPKKRQPIVLNRKDFIEKVITAQCPESLKLREYFTTKNISVTLQSVSYKLPNDYNECSTLHASLVNDVKTPYLCSIYDQIDTIEDKEFRLKNLSRSSYRIRQILEADLTESKIYKSKVTDAFMDYFGNFCKNIEKTSEFCNDFFNTSYFFKVAKKEKPSYKIRNICRDLLKREKLSDKDFEICAKKLDRDENICLYNSRNLPSLMPKPNCTELSRALNFSKLNTDYTDCPAFVGNEGVVNISRILNHFGKTAAEGNYCPASTAARFVEFNAGIGNEKAWQTQLCYDDKINAKEVCYPVFYGSVPGSKYSLDTTVLEILFRTKGASKNQGCKLHFARDYNQTLLENKIGCHIVMSNKCKTTECETKIYYNSLLIDFIKKKTGVAFNYFPTSLQMEKQTQSYNIENEFKKKQRKIQNLTELETQYKNHPGTILHGMGCAEDLLPGFFVKNTFSSCRPISFIVESFIKSNDRISLVTLTSLDDAQTPRVISWSQVFSSVKSYQENHPMKNWSLYALF